MPYRLEVKELEAVGFVARGATPRATDPERNIAFWKRREDGGAGVTDFEDSDAAWEALEALAKAERARDPGLSWGAALVKATESAEGRAAYEVYTSREGVAERRRRREREETLARLQKINPAWTGWGACVADLARKLGEGDPTKGLEVVRKHYPELLRAYREEVGAE